MDKKELGAAFSKELTHYGKKGMRWGVRKRVGSDGKPVAVTTTQKPGKFVKTSGGHNQPASADALKVAPIRQIAKKSSTDALSNHELQLLVTRMNLEQQYHRMSANDPRVGPGAKIARDLLNSVGKQQLNKIANDKAGKLVSEQLKK